MKIYVFRRGPITLDVRKEIRKEVKAYNVSFVGCRLANGHICFTFSEPDLEAWPSGLRL